MKEFNNKCIKASQTAFYFKSCLQTLLLCTIEVKEFSENLSAAELALWLQSKHVPKDDCNIIRGQFIVSVLQALTFSASHLRFRDFWSPLHESDRGKIREI